MFGYTYVIDLKDPNYLVNKSGSGKFCWFRNSAKLLYSFITSAKLAVVANIEKGV